MNFLPNIVFVLNLIFLKFSRVQNSDIMKFTFSHFLDDIKRFLKVTKGNFYVSDLIKTLIYVSMENFCSCMEDREGEEKRVYTQRNIKEYEYFTIG